MGTTVNLSASVLKSPVFLATALRTGALGDDTASVLDVLRIVNQASEFESQDLGAAINSWHNATNKEEASARIAAILESRAKELARIVELASGSFVGTIRFASHGKLVAEINEALKAPAVPVVDLGGAFMEVRRMPGADQGTNAAGTSGENSESLLQKAETLFISRKLDKIALMWFAWRRYEAVKGFLEDQRIDILTANNKEFGRACQKALANTRGVVEKYGSPSSKMQIDNILGIPDDDIAAFELVVDQEMEEKARNDQFGLIAMARLIGGGPIKTLKRK